MSEEIKIPEKTIINIFLFIRIFLAIVALGAARFLAKNNKDFIIFSLVFISITIIILYLYIYLFKKEVDYLEKKHYNIGFDITIILVSYILLNILVTTILQTTGLEKSALRMFSIKPPKV
jgi:membrane protease YdiL (CAAX protease family)